MEPLSCRLLPLATADGAHNMAADEVLLEQACAGTAALRLYCWAEPTVSLGYFQAMQARDQDQRLAKVPCVRRPTGGGAIVHHFELTYALALPPGRAWHQGEPWMKRMHGIVAVGLGNLGVAAQLCSCPSATPAGSILCFQDVQPCDVVLHDAKIVGSAQRRRRGALLQHGSILLTTSPFAPLLPGIRELSGVSLSAPVVYEAVVDAFRQQTGWQLIHDEWSDDAKRRIRDLAVSRYAQDSWNRKR